MRFASRCDTHAYPAMVEKLDRRCDVATQCPLFQAMPSVDKVSAAFVMLCSFLAVLLRRGADDEFLDW